MADGGWINLDRDGLYEVQENIFSGAVRHRVYRENVLFHEWFDGKPPYKEVKDRSHERG
jgi:hypothetical protein